MNTKSNDLKCIIGINSDYRLTQAFYWAMYLVASGFNTYYMSAYGLTNTQIGIIISVFAIFTILLTFVLGRIADKHPSLNWKKQLLIMCILNLLIMAALFILSNGLVIGLAFGLLYMCGTCMFPMINAASFYYEAKGISSNYGTARAIGAAAYAVASFAMGELTDAYGTITVPISGVVLSLLLIIVVLLLPYNGPVDTEECEKCENTKIGWLAIFAKYPAFMIMTLATLLILTFHNMYSTYMIRILERVGGGSANLGIALGVAAASELPMMILASKLVKKFVPSRILAIMPLGFVLRGIILIAAGNVFTVYVGQALSMVSFAVIASVGIYFTDQCMDAEDMVTGQAITGMAYSTAGVFSNLLAGWLIDKIGITYTLCVGLCIAILGWICAVISAVMVEKGNIHNRE